MRCNPTVVPVGVVLGLVAVVAVPATTRSQAATDLAIRVTATSFQVGMAGRYVITVVNNGAAATDAEIAVAAALPAGLAFVSSAGGWQCGAGDGGALCTTSMSIRAGQSTTFSLTVSVAREAIPRASTQFTLRYGGDQRPTNNVVVKTTSVRPSRRPIPTFTPSPTLRPGQPTGTPTRTVSPTISATPSVTRTPTPTATPVPAAANLALSKVVSGRFVVGSRGTYILTASNLGPNATNVPVVVTDTLPAGLTFVSATGTGWECRSSGSAVECTYNDALAASAATSFVLTVQVGESAYPTVTNTAVLDYPADPDRSNNFVRRPTSVRR